MEQAGAARHALEAKLAEAKAAAGGTAKEKEEELAALRARVAAADAPAQERYAVHVEAARPCLPHRRARPHGVLYRHATQRRLILLLLAPIRDHTAPQRL